MKFICFEGSECRSRLELATSWAPLVPVQRDGRTTAPLWAISQLALKGSCPGPDGNRPTSVQPDGILPLKVKIASVRSAGAENLRYVVRRTL